MIYLVALAALVILVWAAVKHQPTHISKPAARDQLGRDMRPDSGVEPHGLCVCDPRPPSSPIGMCPQCRRLDPGKAYA